MGKKRHVLRVISVLLLCMVVTLCYAERSQKLFAVVFGITVDSNGELLNVRIADIIDTYSEEKIKMEIPKEYFENAKNKIEAEKYKPSLENGEPKEFFTYYYFDPERPTLVIDDLKMIE